MPSWKTATPYPWQQAPFIRLLPALIAGIIVYDSGYLRPTPPVLIWGIAGGFLLLIISTLFRFSGPLIPYIRSCLVQLLLFQAAFIICYLSDDRNNEDWFGRHLGAHGFVVRIEEPPLERAKTWKVPVTLMKATYSTGSRTVTGRAWVYLFKSDDTLKLQVGDLILVPGDWQPIANSGNPGSFDYQRFAARKNYHYQQFLPPDKLQLLKQNTKSPGLITRVHTWATDCLDTYLNDPVTQGLLQAMVLGDRVLLDEELRERYTATGIIHIIAISGSHVGVFFLLVSALFFWRPQTDKLKYLIAIPLIWFYVLVAGAPVSAVRAAIMFSFLGLGMTLGKDPNGINTLTGTAFLMLFIEPFWLFDAGFLLSFTAVLSLILFFRPVRNWWRPGNWLLSRLWEVCAASIAAEILIAPLVIYLFHLFPATFLLANALAYLFMFLLLIAGLVIILFSFLPIMANLVAAVASYLTGHFNTAIGWLEQCNPEQLKHLYLSTVELILLYTVAGGAAIFLMRRWKGGLWISLSGMILFLGFGIWQTWDRRNAEMLVVYHLNRAVHIEQVRPGIRRILYSNVTASTRRQLEYAQQGIHHQWGCWKDVEPEQRTAFNFRGNRILLSETPLEPAKPLFETDLLLPLYTLKRFQSTWLEEQVRFRQLILAGNQSRYYSAIWKDSLEPRDIAVHHTAVDGALILQ